MWGKNMICLADVEINLGHSSLSEQLKTDFLSVLAGIGTIKHAHSFGRY